MVLERHYYADYYHFHVSPSGRRSVTSRMHGYLLKHAYPKPDLVICLDAPAPVLFERKREATAEWLEQRPRQCLQLADVVPAFVVVDVNRPLDLVAREVATVITEFYEKRRA
jgi:thymidylate kinase